VIFWLERHGYDATDELVDRVFSYAKSSSTVLTDDEIVELIARR
jgi:hypothetical protein